MSDQDVVNQPNTLPELGDEFDFTPDTLPAVPTLPFDGIADTAQTDVDDNGIPFVETAEIPPPSTTKGKGRLLIVAVLLLIVITGTLWLFLNPDGQAAPIALPIGVGALQIDTQPQPDQVWIGGKAWLPGQPVPIGETTIRLTAHGYEATEQAITISAGERTVIRGKLIDSIDPVAHLGVEPTMTTAGTPVLASVNVADAGEGLRLVTLTVDGEVLLRKTLRTHTYTGAVEVVGLTPGLHRLEVKAHDAASNVARRTVYVQVRPSGEAALNASSPLPDTLTELATITVTPTPAILLTPDTTGQETVRPASEIPTNGSNSFAPKAQPPHVDSQLSALSVRARSGVEEVSRPTAASNALVSSTTIIGLRAQPPTAISDTAVTTVQARLSALLQSESGVNATVRRETITLDTVDYQQAMQTRETFPYPTLDRANLGDTHPKEYQAIVMENAALMLTILPELGGRIYQIIDKQTGQPLLYNNPVIQPTQWGPPEMNWWLLAGGIEWAFPTPEHGYAWATVWENDIKQETDHATTYLWYQDAHTGLTASVVITLTSDENTFDVTMTLINDQAVAVPAHLWWNATFPAGDGMAAHLPIREMVIHSIGEPENLQVHDRIPFSLGLSNWGSWQTWFSGFADGPITGNQMTLYGAGQGTGLSRTFNPQAAPGMKLVVMTEGSGIADYDGKPYMEVWGGINKDFDTPYLIAPSEKVSFTDTWSLATR